MKFRYVFLALALVVIAVVSMAGFRGQHFTHPPMEVFPDMNYQDKVKDQVPSSFFADGNSARQPIPDTVAMEMPAQGDYWSTGKWDPTHWGSGIPTHDAQGGTMALQNDDLNMGRGRERYTISCQVCHSAVGDGKGIVSKYGLTSVASLQDKRIYDMSDGEIFNTITNGKGQMLGYGYNIAIDDRWRIVMYVRALELSQSEPFEDTTPEQQAELNKTRKPAAPAAVPHSAPSAMQGTAGGLKRVTFNPRSGVDDSRRYYRF